MAHKTQTVTKRLLHELQSYENDPSPALAHLGPINDDELLHWTAILKGVPDTAYAGGRWNLSITIPPQYPLQPPTIKFLTPICHPNVHFKTGEICLDLLKTSWSPAYTIAQTLEAVQQLLTSAEPDSPLNVDVAQLLRLGDELGAQALVRFYTRTFRYEG
ncbi:hypothetical protein MBLNU457_6953t2 [Dothideomycetes sp. NU457]